MGGLFGGSVRLAAALGAALAIFGGGGGASAQKAVPQMTVVIYNNSDDKNIYPLLWTIGQPVDQWVQAFFDVPRNRTAIDTYNSLGKHRIYINCCKPGERGIPPGGAVTLRIPLFSALVDEIDPTKEKQLIEWWQGGNINIYQSDAADGPPRELRALWNTADQSAVDIRSNPPECVGPASCNVFFAPINSQDPFQAHPQQLVEYTLGAAPANTNNTAPDKPRYLFDADDVDYDVSYVNAAYLPVVMEPFGNDLIGWIGTPSTIDEFSGAIDRFLVSPIGINWPLFLDDRRQAVRGKIPSALEIFTGSLVVGGPDDGTWLQGNFVKFKPAPQNSAPIKKMIQLFRSCKGGGSDSLCPSVRDIISLLQANYANYAKFYRDTGKGWGCDQSVDPHPSRQPTDLQLMQKLYGWVQFNEHCTPRANLLADTPGFKARYQEIKNKFDKLQYSIAVKDGDYGIFHPYVALIHGPTFIDSEFTYAYSVDDAYGNMQTDGKGIVIAVGGRQRLANPDHVTPNVDFNFGFENGSRTATFERFGRCTATPDREARRNHSSFPVPVGASAKRMVYNCLISFRDSRDRLYQLQLSPDFPVAGWPEDQPDIGNLPAARAPVAASCAKNADPAIAAWCSFTYVFKKRDPDTDKWNYNVQIRAPID